MDTRTERGYLMLADFSGYTSFMAKAELDHAHELTRELLELVSSRLSTLLTLLEVEGDALFVFAPASRVPRGETLLELIESTYVSFRDRLGTIRRHTNCGCVACNSVQSLDLKFFTHFGEYVPQKIAGAFKLIGSDVNLLHRLVKNHITETTGWKAYAMFTENAMNHLNIHPTGFHSSTERYEHLGEIGTHSFDLRSRHRELTDARRVFVEEQDADVVTQREFRCSPPTLWEWLNDPQRRNKWMPGATWSELARPAGRTGPGSSNHCAHGKGASIEQIVDWRPFEYFTTEHHERFASLTITMVLTPTSQGTRLSHHALMKIPLPRLLIRPIARLLVSKLMRLQECWDLVERLIEEEGSELKET